MPAAGHCRRCLLFFSLLLTSIHHAAAAVSPAAPAPSPAAADANTTAHRCLERFGFPQGLLPGNVVSHSISDDDGSFEVGLSEPCYVWFSDLVYFEKTIRGKITFGRISSISGIQVRKLRFLWLDVDRVVASKDGGSVVFTAGFISERHPTSEFKDVRRCEKRAAPLPEEVASVSSSVSGRRHGGHASAAVALI